jgi:hypothetical protein
LVRTVAGLSAGVCAKPEFNPANSVIVVIPAQEVSEICFMFQFC